MSVGASSGILQGAIRDLERLGNRARMLIVSRRAIGITAVACGCAALAIGLDWLFRFPTVFRSIVLALGLTALAVGVMRLIVPALRFRPTPTQLALRIERSSTALRGRLASGIEFALSGADRESALAARSVSDLASRLSGESIRSWLAPRRSFAELSTAFATIAVVTLVALVFPAHARIGATRLFVPFMGAEWPARTNVESLMAGLKHHPKGQPLLLAARLHEGDSADERVSALVRIHRDDGSEGDERLLMTRQSDGRYERVLEGDPGVAAVDVRFASSDHESSKESIVMVQPPAVTSATLTLDPPTYAAAHAEPRTAELGDGTDQRATLREPALVGSSATLTLDLNKPLPPREPIDVWTSSMLAGAALDGMTLDVERSNASRWTLRWTVHGPREIQVTPEDEMGIRAVDDIRFRVEAVEDRPPACAVTEPAADESVLASAQLPAAIEARDDVGLARAGLIVVRQEGGKGARIEAKNTVRDVTEASSALLERMNETLDLAQLGAAPGDVLTLTAVAEDSYELDGQPHDRVTSAPRTLKIISEIELGKQIRMQLAGIRRTAMRLDTQQSELTAAAQNGRFDPAMERSQAQISERVRAASEAVQELSNRIARNRLNDEELGATLDQSKDLLDSSGRASARASEAMQRKREEAQRQATENEKQAATDTVAAQDDVRADLADLIRLLDRDEDSWAMAREIDRLREKVEGLTKRTAKAGERTIGQKVEDLKPADRDELNAIADAQRDAARAAQDLLDELRKRADAVDRVDKGRAEAMRDAAKAGEERRLQRNLEQAGDEARGNRMQQAQSSQQAALDALDHMRRGLDDVRKAKAEELRRALESLEKSIERLVKTNEDELIALARVTGPDDEDGLSERSRAMAKLAQNTQAVAGEARAAGSEAGRIARTLDRAADSHGSAVGFLRAKPARLPDAQTAEERGLALLQEALEAAKQVREQSEQREQAKKLQEIIAAYRQILEKQLGVRDGTLITRPKDPAAKLDRRALIESRRLAIAQGEVGRSMQTMVDEHAEIKGSTIFVEAHALVADWSSQASQRLGDGDLTDRTVAIETQIADAVASLVDSLSPSPPDDNPFQENPPPGGNQGGGGGGNQQSKLPPVAELKLLRGLQVQLFERTKRLDADGASAGAAAELASLARLQERLMGLLEKLILSQQLPSPTGVQPGAENLGEPVEPNPQTPDDKANDESSEKPVAPPDDKPR
ncbi:MAG: hypothetical protein SGJ09_09445 [Phycisphaerae bacterium]|nr:hypothetical protein [Phycisphaerae bacterium]